MSEGEPTPIFDDAEMAGFAPPLAAPGAAERSASSISPAAPPDGFDDIDSLFATPPPSMMVEGLSEVLNECGLPAAIHQAAAWCQDMGADSVADVVHADAVDATQRAPSDPHWPPARGDQICTAGRAPCQHSAPVGQARRPRLPLPQR